METKSVKLEWKNLSFHVKKKVQTNWWKRIETNQQILCNASGLMKTGELIAILGSSGVGKTTLLSSISQRIRGDISGEICLNGLPISREEMAMKSGFVAQHDLIMHLTPKEHLYFMCEFKMSKTTSKWMKTAKINKLLREFGLVSCSDTKITSLSGGEKKKLSLATELITEPSILFCDEPTTGLDSFNAFSVMSVLKQLTKSNEKIITSNGIDNECKSGKEYHTPKAIMCSIHQPTSDIFQCFSHIILMNSGRIVYQGSSQDALIFFSKLGYICPPKYNPADYYVKLIAITINNSYTDDENPAEKIFKTYEKQIESYTKLPFSISPIKKVSKCNNLSRSTSWIRQVYLLACRTAIEEKRKIKEQFIATVIFLITGITVICLYSTVTGRTQEGVQDIEGALVILATEVIFTYSYNVIYVMPSQFPIMRRETGERLYSLSAFYVSSVLSKIPITIIQCFLLMGLVCLFLNPLRDIWLFLGMSITLTIAGITASAYGYMLSAISESTNLTIEIAAPADFIILIFGGFYLNLNSYPILKYMSIFYFTNDCLAYQFWHDVDYIECSPVLGHPCLRNGTEVLREFAFGQSPATIWFDLLGLGIMTFVMHLLGFLGISRIVQKTGFY